MKKIFILFLLLAMIVCCKSIQVSQGKSVSTSVIELSGDNYYPDSVAACKDGTLFVGSMWTGQIDRIPSGMNHPVSFVPPEADGRTALGLLVDEKAGRLWACYWDFHRFMTVPAQLKAFSLKTGKLIKAYDYPKGSICNDLTMDGEGNIYTTCSFTHRIFRLPAGGNTLEIWCDDPLLSAGWKEGWTLNGIEWNGKTSIYVTRTDNDGFYRVSIKKNGSAGTVQQITVADTLTNLGYDGIVALDSNTFLVAEYGTSRLTMINVKGNTGIKKIVSTGLNFPTNAVVVGNGAWVVESQLDHMLGFDKAPPQVPFLIKYIILPSS
jgi:sugar lactone lactonase YvrE